MHSPLVTKRNAHVPHHGPTANVPRPKVAAKHKPSAWPRLPLFLHAKLASSQPHVQAKLRIGEHGDAYEQEADRIAEQVLAQPAHAGVGRAPLRIQRYTAGESTGDVNWAPASVDPVLASPGTPLEPVLRQDMEQRFGYDFSAVRVHSGTAAEQSARELNAEAYTVGQKIAFGASRFAPASLEGRRLLAHELTHVVQQSGATGTGQIQRASPAVIQRQDAKQTTKVPFLIRLPADGVYLKATPSLAADNFPGEKAMNDDMVVVRNTGGAATYRNVKDGSWSWIEIPGKKSPDPHYPTLHGFIESRYIADLTIGPIEPVKKPDPPQDDTKGNMPGWLEEQTRQREAERKQRQEKAFGQSAQGKYAHTKSCSEDFLSNHVWKANDRARAMAHYATEAVSRQYRAWETQGSVYFGPEWRRYRDDITANLNLIRLGFEKGGYTYECEHDCDDDEYAYIYAYVGGGTIHLCENNMNAEGRTVEQSAQTIFHEMARVYAGADAAPAPGGGTYGCDSRSSEDAADSPACLAHFASNIFGMK